MDGAPSARTLRALLRASTRQYLLVASLTGQVDRWFKEKYIRMYVNRYELGGNKNIVVDKDFKTEHASYNE